MTTKFSEYLYESSYLQRVEQDVLNMKKNNLMDRGDFEENLKKTSQSVEKRLGGKAWKDYVKDAKAYATKNRLFKRKDTKRYPYYITDDYGDRVGVEETFVKKLAMFIETEIGNYFPDGDVVDALPGFFRRNNMDYHGQGVDKLIDAACKKYLHVKSLSDFQAKFWEDMSRDAKYDYENSKKQLAKNPSDTRAQSKFDSAEAGWEPFSHANPWK